jgi:hypothetical protein
VNERIFSGVDAPSKTYTTIGQANHAACRVQLPLHSGGIATLRYVVVPAEEQNRWGVVFILREKELHLAGDIARMGHGVTG